MTSCTHLGNDGDPGPEPAQPQLGDVNAVNGDGAAGSLDYPLQTVWRSAGLKPSTIFWRISGRWRLFCNCSIFETKQKLNWSKKVFFSQSASDMEPMFFGSVSD